MGDEMMRILETKYKNEHMEHLNRIARELKPEYVDLVSILDSEMTIELGENLRVQMVEIFKTLKRMGVDVASR